MRLEEVLKGLEYEGVIEDREVTFITTDSRKVKRNSVFVCLKGNKFDGHSAAAAAMEKGASAVVTERRLGLDNEVTVASTRKAMAVLCANYFGNPEKELKLVAVTGTNGKTTTSSVIKQCLENMGIRSGLIGSIHSEIGDVEVPAKFTTPEPWELYALMRSMVNSGCRYLIMEASSQALAQDRLYGLHFECGIFSNLTEDHLDYHKTMENYYQAKKLLFLNSDTSIINIDDSYGVRLTRELMPDHNVIPYSAKYDIEFMAQNVQFRSSGITFSIKRGGREHVFRYNVPGKFSVYNALAVTVTMHALGFDLDTISGALAKVTGVRGRCEVIYSSDRTVICDFAHTPDALVQILSSIKPFAEGRLITLFGCAGDRDAMKRPAMAEAVCRYADMAILTADNPRTENPSDIINEIVDIFERSDRPYMVIPDRYYAVIQALDQMKPGDVLLLCGKGHEDYQVLDGYTIYLDEHSIVRKYFKNKEA